MEDVNEPVEQSVEAAEPDVLTTIEAADLLRISPEQMARLAGAGRIPAMDLGTGRHRCYRFLRSDLLNFQTAAAVVVSPTRRRRKRDAALVKV
jgi:excisionase family DNA binding protein